MLKDRSHVASKQQRNERNKSALAQMSLYRPCHRLATQPQVRPCVRSESTSIVPVECTAYVGSLRLAHDARLQGTRRTAASGRLQPLQRMTGCG